MLILCSFCSYFAEFFSNHSLEKQVIILIAIFYYFAQQLLNLNLTRLEQEKLHAC